MYSVYQISSSSSSVKSLYPAKYRVAHCHMFHLMLMVYFEEHLLFQVHDESPTRGGPPRHGHVEGTRGPQPPRLHRSGW